MASLDKETESVLIYVMRPTVPPPTSTPSYSCCAALIVDLAVSPSLRTASCCSVDVMKGADAVLERGLRSILPTVIFPLASFVSLSTTAC